MLLGALVVQQVPVACRANPQKQPKGAVLTLGLYSNDIKLGTFLTGRQIMFEVLCRCFNTVNIVSKINDQMDKNYHI